MEYFAGFFLFIPVCLSVVAIAMLLISLRLHRTSCKMWLSLLAAALLMFLQSMEINDKIASKTPTTSMEALWAVLHALFMIVFIFGAISRRNSDGCT